MIENDYYQNENLLNENPNINKQEKLSIENSNINQIEKNDEQNIENEKTTLKNPKSSFANNIIEDNIKYSDTIIEAHNNKKKQTDNENEVIYEGDEDLNYGKKNKKLTKNNLRHNININKNLLKYSTITIIIIYIILVIISCVVFHIKRTDYPFLFCFEFSERNLITEQDMARKENIYFLTDLNSFYLIHLVFLFLYISVCYMLIKGKKSDINYFFKDMSIFFICTLIFNIPIFIIGMLSEKFYGNHLKPMVFLCLTFCAFLCMIKIFIVAKRHKYKNITNLINVSILTSFMTAYQCYCFIFCLCYSSMNFFKPEMMRDKEDNVKEYPEIEIIASSIYFAIGIIIMTVFKDIFFVIAMAIIESGFLYAKKISNYLLTTTLVNLGLLSLNFASIIIIIFAYNKKVFRLKEKQ